MQRPLHDLRRIQRYAATLLLALMVYQFGVCPCGCLEHNAWVQMLGIDVSDHDAHIAIGDHDQGVTTVVSGHNEHDCAGKTRPKYVDNARSISIETVSTTTRSSVAMIPAFAATRFSDANVGRCRVGKLPEFAAARDGSTQFRAKLQVFRL